MFKRLSYITIKGNLGKLLPQMTVLDKDELKFVMNQVNGIRVVIATKWRHTFFYYFTHSRIYRHRDYILLPKSIMEAFSTNSFPTVCEVWMTFLRALEIFWDEVFLLEIQYKTEQSWCSAIIIRKRSAVCINHDNTVNPLIKQARPKMPTFNYLSLVA